MPPIQVNAAPIIETERLRPRSHDAVILADCIAMWANPRSFAIPFENHQPHSAHGCEATLKKKRWDETLRPLRDSNGRTVHTEAFCYGPVRILQN